jgi:hypothetical protein
MELSATDEGGTAHLQAKAAETLASLKKSSSGEYRRRKENEVSV